jgi:phospholipid/cholesterol/gamma-HCH transport system substrate-binding protein
MTNEQKVGLFFVIGLLLVLAGIEVTVGTGLLHSRYRLYVKYPSVEGLRNGDAVQVAGVKLGTVGDIALQTDGVRVRLDLGKEAVVRRDSVATLEAQLLSGNRFITISLGSPSAPILKDGDTIEGEVPPSMTRLVSDMRDVAHSVQSLADSLNENQERLLTNVNTMIEQNRASLRQTLENVESVTAKLDRGDGTLAKLINDPTLYDRATVVMADLQKVSDRLARGEGDLGRLVNSDGALYDDAREAVARLNVTATNLEEISTQVRNGEGTLGRFMTDDSLYQDAQSAMRGLDRATASVEDQSPISVLSTLITSLF